MAVGGYYFDDRELKLFAQRLEEYAGSVKDLSKLYREIGKYAGNYVKAHEPLPSYDTSKNSASHLPLGYMQSRTKGGGGKSGAWVTISDVPYLYLHEFGGGSRWYRGARQYETAVIGISKGGHDITRRRRVAHGHTVYTLPRVYDGRFIWNVAYRLRNYIGEKLAGGLQIMAAEHGLLSSLEDKTLIIPKNSGPRG